MVDSIRVDGASDRLFGLYFCSLSEENSVFLNFVCVLCQLAAEYLCKIIIVEDDHVSVVSFVIVVLPAFVPPAKTNDAGPSI